jgi:hypothetical protein
MVLSLPAGGRTHYRVALGLYDPATGGMITHSDIKGVAAKDLVEIGSVEQGQEGQPLKWAPPSS